MNIDDRGAHFSGWCHNLENNQHAAALKGGGDTQIRPHAHRVWWKIGRFKQNDKTCEVFHKETQNECHPCTFVG